MSSTSNSLAARGPPQSNHTSSELNDSERPQAATQNKDPRPLPNLLSLVLNFGMDTTPEKDPDNEDDESEEGEDEDNRTPDEILRDSQEKESRRRFILILAKALMTYGAPSHRVEAQLVAASLILKVKINLVYLPNLVIATVRNRNTIGPQTFFVRAKGRIALSRLTAVHHVYRKVLHEQVTPAEGAMQLNSLLRKPPVYGLWQRCVFAFIGASVLCATSFGGSFVDMWISGLFAATLQYLGLNSASKSVMYANVYEISGTIIIAFAARGLSNIPGNRFCYTAISGAGVVGILPGFTVLVSSLELMSKNFFCGSVRLVYAIVYTLLLGFGLTLGSDLYLVVDHHARDRFYAGPPPAPPIYIHGVFELLNGSTPGLQISGTMGLTQQGWEEQNMIEGCFRDPRWSWPRQPFPWWSLLFLVPLYCITSSMSNQQKIHTWHSRKQLAIMVFFACCSYTANKAIGSYMPERLDVISATGAFVIGCLGNTYSRLMRGTAFTAMVTGVVFLVPSGIAQGGGLTQEYASSGDQYSQGMYLVLKMISIACGVAIGLFGSQIIIYLFGNRKNTTHFAF